MGAGFVPKCEAHKCLVLFLDLPRVQPTLPVQRAWVARHVRLEWRVSQESPPTMCSPVLAARLGQAIRSLGYPVRELASGAGHDGAALSALTPFAMLLVRCKGGVSHNPAESVEEADVAAAIDALERFLHAA